MVTGEAARGSPAARLEADAYLLRAFVSLANFWRLPVGAVGRKACSSDRPVRKPNVVGGSFAFSNCSRLGHDDYFLYDDVFMRRGGLPAASGGDASPRWRRFPGRCADQCEAPSALTDGLTIPKCRIADTRTTSTCARRPPNCRVRYHIEDFDASTDRT